MATATFRFYEELNDFLPADRRKRDIRLTFETPAPVRHLFETLGVPHTEVEIILINRESVSLEQPVSDGDRVSVYPMFESLDVTPLLRLREQPLRNPRFLADAHLGRLAGYLRMLGFDTLYDGTEADHLLVARSRREGRILLTRDRALLMHRRLTHGCYVRARAPRQQLADLVQRLDLCRKIQPFTRCIRCNTLLKPVSRATVFEQLPEKVREARHSFRRCPGCSRVYWKGTHYQRMQLFIQSLC